jgi:hypothetical protein
MNDKDYTPYQRRVIQRYYQNQPQLLQQRLADLVGELFLAQGKKRQQCWKRTVEILQKLGVPQSRIDYLLAKNDPALLAGIVKELQK